MHRRLAMHPCPTLHPWIAALRVSLDGLEKALLQGDAPAVERASAHVQAVLQQAPRAAAFAAPGSPLDEDVRAAAQRFTRLRQAVLRAQAQSQRAVRSLLSQPSPAPYGHLAGQNPSTGGAGRAYLSV